MFLNLNMIRNMLVIKLLLSNREDFENENEGGRLFYTFPRFPSKSEHRNKQCLNYLPNNFKVYFYFNL